jgi:hypothetical protein
MLQKVYSLLNYTLNFNSINTTGLPMKLGCIMTSGAIIDGYCYIYGGLGTGDVYTNKIYRSKNRIQAMAQPETQPYIAQKAIFPNGDECEYSLHQKAGTPHWQVDTYAPRISF